VRDFILNAREPGQRGFASMSTDGLAEVDETRRQLDRLKDATRHRHALVPGTPEYEIAFQAEERLLLELWHVLEGIPTGRRRLGAEAF
jgi:hypothetical protein